ncbi:MAG: TonB-dependent receptor [Pseudohongiellaceae bacterium]
MTFNHRIRPLQLAICMTAAWSGSSMAQDNMLETIFVTSDRQGSAIGDIPSSIHAVDRELLDTFKQVHIGEVLNTVPGVVFNRGNGQESLLGIRSPVLTGAGSCGAYQVSQDGIPVRAAGFCNVNQLFEANTEQAQAIEIIRGPGSVLFGANALHGAINVINPALSGKPGGVISVDAGPNEYGRLNLGINTEEGEHQFGVYFNGASDGGYKDDSGFDQQKLNVGHRYDGGNVRISSSFAVTNLNQETAGFLVGTNAYKDSAKKRENANPEAFRDVQSFRFHTRIEGDTENGTWMVTPYYRNTDMTFLMHFLPGTPLEENGHDSFGLQTLYSFNSSDDVNWTVGLDMESTDGLLKQTQAGGFGSFPAGKQYDFTVEASMWSPYALMKWQSSEQDQISLALRYEFLEYDYDNRMIDGNTAEDGSSCTPSAFNPSGTCRYSRPSDRSDNFDNLTAQIGWIHDFDASTQLFANYSLAFRAPQATELYRLQVNQSVADLDSEQVNSFEVGYRASRGNMSFGVAAYWMEKEDVIFQDSARNNISGGETSHRGIELDSLFSLTDDLSLKVVASYARHKYEANIAPLGVRVSIDGNDMDTAPRLVGNVQLNWNINSQNSLNIEWVHMDDYYTDEANLHRYEGHDLVNLRYRYDSSDNWYFAARVTNLFDEDYAERADFSSFGGDRYFVGEPASLYVTVGSRF